MGEFFWQNVLLYVLYIWSIFWKGIALWRSAHYRQRNWFVFMLVLNTIGILELVYLFRFSKKRLTFDEMKNWKNIFIKKVPEKSS